MKILLLSTLVSAAPFAAAFGAERMTDNAADALRRDGSVNVSTAGPHVAVGTFRVQVAAKLGRPDLTLADGSWLYRGRRVDGSFAQGTLVIRFNDGRVNSLLLATDAVVADLRANPNGRAPNELVATR